MSDRNARWWRAAIVLASAAVFIASLTQTAFVTECCYVVGDTRPFDCASMLLTGWMGVLGGSLHPVLFVSIIGAWVCVCIESRFGAVILAFCAIGVVAKFPETVLPNAGYAVWLVNPIIVTTWFLYLAGKRPAALISAVSALGLTLSFLRVTDVPLSDKLTPVEIISYGTGYWLWIASTGFLMAGVSADTFLFRYVAHRMSWQDRLWP